MVNFILRRLLQTLVTIFALSFVCYYIMTLMPGDPLDIMISSNPNIKPEDIERLKALYGLDKPAYMRYFNWLSQTLSGDLGYSRTYRVPVSDIIGPRLMNTFYLGFASLTFSLLIAIPCGIFAALRSGQKLDYVINLGAFAGISIPSFWLGIMLIIIFAVLPGPGNGLPAGGTQTVGVTLSGWDAFVDRISHLILPILSLSVMQIGSFVRYTRSSMLETLRADYVRTAKAKGLPRQKVIYMHAFRNALIPVVTVIAISFSFVFSGAIITETIFSYEGVGKLVYDAIVANDFNVAMVSFMISIIMVLSMNLLADILYGVLDPRISYS